MTSLQVQSFKPDLNSLQNTINTSGDDITPLIPFIESLDKFAVNDKQTAMTLLQTVFWSEQSNNYIFTDKFKLLQAQHLSIIIKQIGNKKIEDYIFEEHNKELLSHYPLNPDLLSLLSAHYSDRFANFVFNQFRGFLKSPLSARISYFKIISVKAIIMILKNGGIGKSLSCDELIIICIKMKKYLIENKNQFDVNDNSWLDSQSILPEVIQLILGSNGDHIKSLTTNNIQTIIDNDLIINIKQSHNIINELLQRQRKLITSSSSNGILCNNISTNNFDKLIGMVSTDNFANFQQSISNTMNQTLDGPLVIMPIMTKNEQKVQDKIDYSCLVQIQDLNPLFNQNTNINNIRQQQPKGAIFVILLHKIPKDYEIVLSVANSFNNLESKDLCLGMNNTNPICSIPWPLPKIGRAVSFVLRATLQKSQQQIQRISYGIGNLLSNNDNISQSEQKQDNDNNNNNNNSLWNITGNKIIMMIYSGKRSNNNGFGQNNVSSNRLSWINCIIQNNNMTFYDLLDSATAQLGLPSPTKQNQSQQQQQQQQSSLWSSFDQNDSNNKNENYVVRNQMGHRVQLSLNVVKYLDKMVMNSNLFPIFIFTTNDKNQSSIPSSSFLMSSQQRGQGGGGGQGGQGRGSGGGGVGIGGLSTGFNFGTGNSFF